MELRIGLEVMTGFFSTQNTQIKLAKEELHLESLYNPQNIKTLTLVDNFKKLCILHNNELIELLKTPSPETYQTHPLAYYLRYNLAAREILELILNIPYNGISGANYRYKIYSNIFLKYEIKNKNIHGNNLLFYACIHNKLNMVKYLIKNGAVINEHYIDAGGWTPLIAASAQGHIKIVELLIENNADINATDNNEYNALWYALKNNHLEVAKLLIKKGILINEKILNESNIFRGRLIEIQYDNKTNENIKTLIGQKIQEYFFKIFEEREKRKEKGEKK